MKLDFRKRLLASTLIASAGLMAHPAFAQDSAQSTVPDENQATNPGGAPATGAIEAQPTPTTSAQGEAVQQSNDIVITGTRIPQPNLESAAPVTVVNTQDIKLSGATRIDEVLAQLPSAATPQGASLPNPSTGTAEVDLRYLGAKRTLTLINGRRITPGDPGQGTSQAGDINIIPASMLKRVEVLTGGASSVYGADAVAGVVNFIMDTDFNGLRFDGQISQYQHNNDCPSIQNSGGLTVCDPIQDRIQGGFAGFSQPSGSVTDGRAIDATISFGAGFDDGRGHVMGYFGYRKQKAVLQGARDYSACTLNVSSSFTCGGSSYSAEGNFRTSNPNGASGFYTPGADGTLRPGRTRYNYAPLNHWIKPDERYIGGVFANYEVAPMFKPYLEFMFMDDKQQAQIAPSGNFANTFSINCDNPFLSAANRAIVCQAGNLVSGYVGNFPLTSRNGGAATPINFVDSNGTQYQQGYFQVFRRNVEGGPRQTNFKHTTYRGVVGTRGDLSNAFSYDAYYQYGRTNYVQQIDNEFSASRLARSINVINDPRVGSPTYGQPICRSVLDGSDPTCVPYNYFGEVTPEALAYVNVSGTQTGETTEQIANVNFTALLGEYGVQTPWATDGAGLNFGYEYRREYLNLKPDALYGTGDLTGQGAATLPNTGSFNVNELFAEVQLPIVQRNFIEELTLNAGYRKSWYKTSAGRKYDTDTYKLEVQFAPVRDLRFRGSYNRAVRAPNIVELFTQPHVALDGTTDPCAGHALKATEYGCIAQFQAAGIANPVGYNTPANPSTQYNGNVGGNPNLVPEIATTKTLGLVLQPRFLPRFAFTVDYWNIDLKKAIQGFGADSILADCIANSTSATDIAASCALIHRDASGSIWLTPAGYVNDLPNNVGRIKTDGYDFNASYSHKVGPLGNLSFSFLGTYLRRYKVNNGISPIYDCAGYYGSTCSGASVASASAMPTWRHKLRTTLQTPMGVGVSLNWRRVGKVKYEGNSDNETLNGGGGNTNPLIPDIKAQDYFDLAATYTLLDRVNLRAGVNNIFDKSPPIIASGGSSCPSSACAGNTYPGTWDYLGRYMYLGATIDFKHKPAPIAALAPVLPPAPAPVAPATQTCQDGSVILATDACPVPPPPPAPPAPAPERG